MYSINSDYACACVYVIYPNLLEFYRKFPSALNRSGELSWICRYFAAEKAHSKSRAGRKYKKITAKFHGDYIVIHSFDMNISKNIIRKQLASLLKLCSESDSETQAVSFIRQITG